MDKIWTWFKSLSLIAVLGAIGTAILFILNAMKASRLQKRAAHAEAIAENIIQDHTKKNIDKAAELQKKAASDKSRAKTAKEKAEAQLAAIGDKDETMADIADRFNKRQLHDSAS